MACDRDNYTRFEEFKKPDDLEKDGLRYAWVTNAPPSCVTAEGDKVTYQMGTGSKDYQPALIGPPSQHWPSGVGIYTLKQ